MSLSSRSNFRTVLLTDDIKAQLSARVIDDAMIPTDLIIGSSEGSSSSSSMLALKAGIGPATTPNGNLIPK
uniref:Uncharacterized protein n=1 Tax=Vespula pensylvanica TaxID=30213 RepID=A0A834NRY7_VESPE|nr:hypothetical protein H0235_011210 [Vespula pensylvanica]